VAPDALCLTDPPCLRRRSVSRRSGFSLDRLGTLSCAEGQPRVSGRGRQGDLLGKACRKNRAETGGVTGRRRSRGWRKSLR